MSAPRWLVAAVVLAAVVGLVVVDRAATTDQAGPDPIERLMPVAAPADAPATTAYCAAGTARGADGPAEQIVVMANTTDASREVTVTVFTDEGAPQSETLTLDPLSRQSLRVADVVEARWAGALVEADGGGVAVDHVLSGPTGTSGGPCATSASTSWYFPAGSTLLGVRNRIVLFNPFAQPAVVDVEAETADGRRRPNELQGIFVNPRSVRVVDLDAVVTVRDQVAVVVNARSGLVVAEQLEIVTPDAQVLPASLSVTLGAPAPAPSWYFPLGAPVIDRVTQQYVVFNPTGDVADVDVQILVDDPATNGFVEPFEITIRPGQYAVVDLGEEERVPAGVPLGAYVESINGVPVVAARAIRSGATGAAAVAAGVAGPGTSITVGAPLLATEWVVPFAGARGGNGVRVAVSNLGLRDTEVTLVAYAGGSSVPLGDAGSLLVRAGNRVEIELAQGVDSTGVFVVVTSAQPVAVERGVDFGGDGFMVASAVAGASTVSRPSPALPDTSTSPTVVLDGQPSIPPTFIPPTTAGATATTGVQG